MRRRDAGLRDILILERSGELGGILNQCIHAGFGLHTFHQELTGPEYAQRYIDAVHERGIPAWTDCMVLDITPDRVLTVTGRAVGLQQIRAQAVVLAMGCRERPRGALNIAGTRPAGIWSAGTAQRMVNMEGYLPGRLRRHRPHHGPPHDAGGRGGQSRGGGHALFRRSEAQHRPVSG